MRRLLALIVLSATSAAAQTPEPVAQTSDPAVLRDRIMQLADTAELRRIEDANARATLATDVFTAGFAALRLTELTGDRDHARRGRAYFDRVVDREPGNAWAHYGYALSFRADIEHVPAAGEIVATANAFRVLGIDAVSRARRALERAVRIDPALPGAVELLAEYAAETNDREGLEQARDALAESYAAGRASEYEVVALAATTRRLGDPEGAADVARQLTATERPSPAGLLELARALVHVPGEAANAGSAYLRALDAVDDVVTARMWADAELLARQHERDAWNRANSAERRALLRRFWELRAALAGIPVEERIAEHYRRIDYAAEHYPRRGMYGAAPSNALELRKISDVYDDRGVIYIRHGHPRDVIPARVSRATARLQGTSVVRWESWGYIGDSGQPVLYHFALFPHDYGDQTNEGGSVDYVLVHNLDCGVADDRHVAYDRRLTSLLWRCSALEQRSVSAVIRRDARDALRTESARPQLDLELPFHFDHYTFRGTNGRTEVVAAVGVPRARLDRPRALDLALTVADTATGTIARTVATTPVVDPSLDQPSLLRTFVAVETAPAATAIFRISIFDVEDRHVGRTYGGPLNVPDYRGDTLMVSDIVIAQPLEQGTFRRDTLSFALSPTQRFESGAFRVFYEIYNLAPGTRYRTELSVEAVDGGLRRTLQRLFGRSAPVMLAFDGFAPDAIPGGTLREVRSVQAALPAGSYRLKVSITAAGARHPLVRERRFTIGPGPVP